MKSYYYTNGKTNFGPFTVEELKDKSLTKDTFVWADGYDNWQTAGTVPELRAVLVTLPSQGVGLVKSSRKLVDILVVVSIAYWLFKDLVFRIFPFLNESLQFKLHPVIPYVNFILNMLFVFIPVIMACSVQQKNPRITALILSIVIALLMLVNNISMLVHALKVY